MAQSFAVDKSGQAANPIALAGGWWLLIGDLTLSGSYATGGDALDLSNFFPAGRTIRKAVVISEARGLSLEYDVANKKMKLFGLNPAAATLDVAPAEHPAAAYDADLTGSAMSVAILLKG